MGLVHRGGEDTFEGIQCVLLYQFGWLLIPDGYGPGKDGVFLIGISVSLEVFDLIAMVGSCISWG